MPISQRTGIISAGVAASLVVLGISGYGLASGYKTVTVEADGITKVVSGFYPDVAAAISGADVEVGYHDVVAPDPQSDLSSGDVVTIDRAQEFVSADSNEKNWSAATSLSEAARDIAPKGGIVVNRADTREPLPLTTEAKAVTVTVDGKDHPVEAKGGESVDAIIDDAGIDLSPIDMVSVDPDGTTVVVTTQTRGTVERTEEIAFKEQRVDDPELLEGTETVKQEGVNGKRVIGTYVQSRGGTELVNVPVYDRVEVKPTDRIVSVGTKKEEEPKETTSSASTESSTFSAAPAPSANIGDPWAALAQCESGGNPATNTGNGFYGMYQFSLPTWQAMGGTGLPSDASAEEQTARAKALQAQSGWGQWPACSASLGLR